MSGHSHAKTVKRVKEAAAAQRSKIFSKIANELALAARGGGDPGSNAQLRSVIEKAKKANMPSANIERALKRGSGAEGTADLQEFLVDAYGPGAVPLLIAGITDNKNRALSEIKQVVEKYGGRLVEEGATRWMFERKGVLCLPKDAPREATELAAIEAGAEDLAWEEEGLVVYTAPAQLADVQEKLQGRGIRAQSAAVEWVPKELRDSLEPQEKLDALLGALDEHEAVQGVYSTLP